MRSTIFVDDLVCSLAYTTSGYERIFIFHKKKEKKKPNLFYNEHFRAHKISCETFSVRVHHLKRSISSNYLSIIEWNGNKRDSFDATAYLFFVCALRIHFSLNRMMDGVMKEKTRERKMESLIDRLLCLLRDSEKVLQFDIINIFRFVCSFVFRLFFLFLAVSQKCRKSKWENFLHTIEHWHLVFDRSSIGYVSVTYYYHILCLFDVSFHHFTCFSSIPFHFICSIIWIWNQVENKI